MQSITSVKHLPTLSRYSFFKPFDTRTQNFHLIFVITSKWCMACDFALKGSCTYCSFEGLSVSMVVVFVVLLKRMYVTCISL